jgi:hypothetical protein
MSFMLYVGGFLIVIAGVAWGMVQAGVSTTWVVITGLILFGFGILSGVSRTRTKDIPKDPNV